MPVTVNMGMEMNSWYDINSLDFTLGEKSYSKESVIKSASRINRDIGYEIDAFNESSGRVFKGGFSQGGCMALHCGL